MFRIHKTALALLACAPLLPGQTRDFLEAPVLQSRLNVRLDPSGKKVEWLSERGLTPRDLTAGKVFLAKESIRVTYERLNPLRVQAKTKNETAADPSAKVMADLLTAIKGVAGLVIPAPSAGTVAGAGDRAKAAKDAACSVALVDAYQAAIDKLFRKQAPSLEDKVKAWPAAIDSGFGQGLTGAAAVQRGIDAIQADMLEIKKLIGEVEKTFEQVRKCADASTSVFEKASVDAIEIQVGKEIERLTAFMTQAGKLSKEIEPFAATNRWMGRGGVAFILGDEVKPTFEEMRNVTITITPLSLGFAGSSLSSGAGDPIAVQATVRKFARMTVEPGAGLVIGTVREPKYGTAANQEGKLVVKRTDDSTVTANPAVTANFVCRCGTGLVTPLLQIGALASKSTPGVLSGAGLRLFGSGKVGVAIAGGAMYAWVKDLKTLKEGSVVTGTAEIDADRGFRTKPQIGGYFSLQVQF